MGRTLRRGEIRWYRFHAPDKRRPVVVLTREAALGFLSEVTVAPITSTVRGIPTEVVLTKADGLLNECAVNLDHLQTVSKARIGPLITRLNDAKMEELHAALMFALGLERDLKRH
jgi:mRNA interferase MazF